MCTGGVLPEVSVTPAGSSGTRRVRGGHLSVSSYDSTFIGADGITVDTVDSIATYGCLADSTLFPSDALRPASQYAGVVLLDLPAASGTLIWSPTTFSSNSAGWEITY